MFYHQVEDVEETSEENRFKDDKFDLEDAIAELGQFIFRTAAAVLHTNLPPG